MKLYQLLFSINIALIGGGFLLLNQTWVGVPLIILGIGVFIFLLLINPRKKEFPRNIRRASILPDGLNRDLYGVYNENGYLIKGRFTNYHQAEVYCNENEFEIIDPLFS